MKIQISTAALVLVAAAPVFAQTSGVSHPDTAVISTDDATTTTAPALKTRQAVTEKPSAAVAAPAAGSEVYGAYVPYMGPKVAGANVADTDAPAGDVDGQIITSVPEREGELRQGTLLKTQIKETLSTSFTAQGSRFTAEIMEPIEKNGKVVIPAGAILEGQVTEVHGGLRISGTAALHLETRDVLLPDGTHYVVHAQLIDAGRKDLRVTDEGTLKRKDHAKETLAVVGGVTGAGAVAGAMLGGGVGAVVGAGIGAGVSTVLWLKQDRQATLPKDVELVFSLTEPMILTPLSSVSSLGGGAQ